jgi:hypothetical protein
LRILTPSRSAKLDRSPALTTAPEPGVYLAS